MPIASSLGEPRLLVLICTYNERENLPQLIARLREVLPWAELLVVDDQSPDGTGEWVSQQLVSSPWLKLVQRPGKLGLGSAIRQGLQYAVDNDYEWVLNIDADLSHEPETAIDLWNLACAPSRTAVSSREARDAAPIDLVIGSRYVSGGSLVGCSWKRKLVSRAANLATRTLLGIRISDCSSAFRLYRVASLAKLDLRELRCNGYGFLEEILLAILRGGGRVEEVPIRYVERQQGTSKIAWHEAADGLATLCRLAWGPTAKKR
jgi:dolichol-phosphate mannosyltransferase